MDVEVIGMSNKRVRAPKAKSSAPRIALCLGIVGALYVIYFIGAMIYATQKYNADQGPEGSYGAAVADHEAAYGPMTNEQRNQFVRETKDERENAANSAIEDWIQRRRATAFNKKLKGTWRTIPQGGEPSREFRAVLYRNQFILESDRESEAMTARLGITGQQRWSNSAYKIRAVPADDALEIRQSYSNVTLNILPCRKVVKDHAYDDCMTRTADGIFIDVAYRVADVTDDEQSALRAGVARVLQDIERVAERRAFKP